MRKIIFAIFLMSISILFTLKVIELEEVNSTMSEREQKISDCILEKGHDVRTCRHLVKTNRY